MRPLKTYKHNLSHEHLGTYDMGPLYPNLLIETLPGDNFEIVTEAMSRFEAMTSATFSRIDKFQYYFYVPKRLVFTDYYEKYRFGGKDGNDNTVPPYMSAPAGGYGLGSLADYLGVPTGVTGFDHSAMPFRAYELICNNWFLSDHLDTFFNVLTTPGLDTTTNTSLVYKKWEKDRFTSALPSSQLTQNPAYLPIAMSAPVIGNGSALGLTDGASTPINAGLKWSATIGLSSSSGKFGATLPTTDSASVNWTDTSVLGVTKDGSKSGVIADLSTASAVSIPQLRTSIVVQQFMETLNRTGSRPVEAVLGTFGIRIPDYRLDRSQFISGSRTPVMITPVEQTSESGTTPQGTLTGRGICAGTTGCKCFCHEDGYIIGLVCYLPRTSYSQGLDRLWTRTSRYDEFIPNFQGIGDQEIKEKEIYLQSDSVVDSDGNVVNNLTFGYEDRYNEFRHMYSKVHGQYRPGGSMNDRTLTRQFNSAPGLTSSFVTADPSKRIFAVQTPGVDHIEAEFYHHIRAWRPVKRFGNPGIGKV